jgi:peptide/nickel transport system permease protein
MSDAKKKSPGYWRMIWQQYRRNRLAVAGLVFIVMLVFIALAAPWIATSTPLYCTASGACLKAPIPYTPTEYNLDDTLAPPSARHWFGTDEQGRDVAARMVYGTRISLAVGVVAVGIYVLIGILLGAAAGYYGGWVDQIVSRAIEIMICFPTFFLILTLLAFVGPSIYNIMIIIGLTSWTGVARLVRGEFLKLKTQEFVQAAIALGANDSRIIFRHMLPNALAPVLVSATFGVAAAILIESGLSFLGFGVPPHVPSWGSILSQSQEFMDIAWWLTAVPGAAIFVTITVYNIVGEGLRDAIDPRLKV